VEFLFPEEEWLREALAATDASSWLESYDVEPPLASNAPEICSRAAGVGVELADHSSKVVSPICSRPAGSSVRSASSAPK
jgi:hypothetical protein